MKRETGAGSIKRDEDPRKVGLKKGDKNKRSHTTQRRSYGSTNMHQRRGNVGHAEERPQFQKEIKNGSK